MSIANAAAALQTFSGADLTRTLAAIEASLTGCTVEGCADILSTHRANHETLSAAGVLKRLAGQINVVIHALGILLCLERVLESGEVVEYVSLGAGNTGRPFDLETDRRVAEFKFISWQGGPETIRQNALFKDFYLLAEHETPKAKFLYVLGTEFPLKFFNSKRSLGSVLSRNVSLNAEVKTKYPDCSVVRDYYAMRRDQVMIRDVSPYLQGLSAETPEIGAAQQTESESDL